VGTEFNVKQRNNYFEVKCFEGIVKVTSNTLERTLYAGDAFQFLNGVLVEEKVTLKSPLWVAGTSSFKSVPFKLVVNEFKRQYNISVTFKGVDVTRQFTGGFNHNNLKQALLSITKPMGLTYELSSSNHVIIHENKE
jgi:ferric-dicitrate binding protein FerR (iron transport regulator)